MSEPFTPVQAGGIANQDSPEFEHWLLSMLPFSPGCSEQFRLIEALVTQARSDDLTVESRLLALSDLRKILDQGPVIVQHKLELVVEVAKQVYEELSSPRVFDLMIGLLLEIEGIRIEAPDLDSVKGSLPSVDGDGFICHAVTDNWSKFIARLAGMSRTELMQFHPEDRRAARKHLVYHMVLGFPRAAGNTLAERRLEFCRHTGMSLWNSLAGRAKAEATRHWQHCVIHHLRGAVETQRARDDEIRTASKKAERVVLTMPLAPLKDPPTHVVANQTPPRARDDETAAVLKRFASLARPIPLALMPSESMLSAHRTALSLEFPWAHDAIDAIFAELIGKCRLGAETISLNPILLSGPAGCGKSRLGRRLAEGLQLQSLTVNLGGAADHRSLVGTARGWSSGEPSPILSLYRRGCATGVILIDDIDKSAGTAANSPPVLSALLSFLEPMEAARWHDPFLQVDCDLSSLIWICTCNSTAWLPGPLLSRLRVLRIGRPTARQLRNAVPYACQDLAREWHLGIGAIDAAAIVDLLPRRLDNLRQLRAAVSSAATRLALHDSQPQALH